MKLTLLFVLFQQLFCQCTFNDIYVRNLLQSNDFAPVGAGQNEVFFSMNGIHKEIRMPKKKKDYEKYHQQFLSEYKALKEFQNDFYVLGIQSNPNQCVYSYIAADIIQLEDEYENFTPFQAQKWEDFYYYQTRLVRHRFMDLKKSQTPHFSQVYKQLRNDKNFYLTYFLQLNKGENDLYDMLLQESTQNWAWRLDISLQLIRFFKYFKAPRFDNQSQQDVSWHHLDIKPENIIMQDHYTPLISDLGNATKETTLFNGTTLLGTAAYLDPTIITLQYFFETQTEEELQEKNIQIEERYQKADEYALGATLLQILLPHLRLDYDQDIQNSNIQEILGQLQTQVEYSIIGFLRNLLTDHYEIRSTLEDAESLFFQLIFYLKKELGVQLQLAEFLENQFDFYLFKNYNKTKKDFWKDYVNKIKQYQEYYNMQKDQETKNVDLERFFNKFKEMENSNFVKRRNKQKRKIDKFKRMQTNNFFQKDVNISRSQTFGGSQDRLIKKGIFGQLEVVGNLLNLEIPVQNQRGKQNNKSSVNSFKRAYTIDQRYNKKQNQYLKI